MLKERESQKRRGRAQDFENINRKIAPSLSMFSLPLRIVTFLAPVIDRHDGFPQPIREEIPRLVRNDAGASILKTCSYRDSRSHLETDILTPLINS